MRDILLFLIVVGSLPYALMRPHIGLLVWSWLGYMNPHRLTFGFAYSAPFVAVVAVVTIVAMVFSKEKKSFPWTGITIAWLLFIIWSCFITYWFAINPSGAAWEFNRLIKIQIMILCTLLLITTKERLIQLVWVIAMSIGFFGIKGGVFALGSGFNYRVKGPAGTFIGGNNELAMALLMVIPLFYFLFTVSKSKYIKLAIIAFILLCFFSVVASYSRGAFLGMAMMSIFLWWGMKRKILIAGLVGIILAIGLPLLPSQWFERMNTIETYQEDASANSRFNTWLMAINLANDRPIVGGGFKPFSAKAYQMYAPNPDLIFDAHSIYFEVLASQGYVGFILFMSMLFLVLFKAQQIKMRCKKNDELSWMAALANMVQVSFVAYMVAGAFLGMAYFDLPYHLMSIVVILDVLYRKHQQQEKSAHA